MRIDPTKVSPDAVRAIMALQLFVNQSGLEPSLLELVKLRASYLNGCGYCVDMHTIDARALGESEQRLYAVPVWRETPFFSPRERAALAFTESVTILGREGVPDAVYENARAQFTDAELVKLTTAVITINAWNRLMVTFNVPAGNYRPRAAMPAVA
jgi:AhpD family alkylhydroperoxidase